MTVPLGSVSMQMGEVLVVLGPPQKSGGEAEVHTTRGDERRRSEKSV